MPPAIMLLVIIGLASVVTIMVTGKLNDSQKSFEARWNEIEAKDRAKGRVVYTIKDIPEGETIPSDALEEREIAKNTIPADAITAASLASGRVAKYGISTGNIVSQHDLAPQGILLGFDARLKQGMRAVTFGVDNNSGVAGFVSPESHVDILGMVGTGPDTKAAPILSDVEVIAVGQIYQKSPGQTTSVPASSVTVAVSPEDARKLVKAILAGKLYLTLRNAKDNTPVATVDITSLFPRSHIAGTEIATLPPPSALPPPPLTGTLDGGPYIGGLPAAVPPPTPLHEIEVWSGSKKDVLSVPKN
jgi:pilus assembly protein CpaB